MFRESPVIVELGHRDLVLLDPAARGSAIHVLHGGRGELFFDDRWKAAGYLRAERLEILGAVWPDSAREVVGANEASILPASKGAFVYPESSRGHAGYRSRDHPGAINCSISGSA